MNIPPIQEWLWPNIPTFLTTIGVVIVMYILFRKYLFLPMKEYLDKRNSFIEKNINDSIANKENSNKVLEDAKANFQKNLKESEEYTQFQFEKANKEATELLKQAKLEIKSLKDESQNQLKLDVKNAHTKLQDEISNIAVEVAKKILEKEINDKDYKKLINDFVKEIKND